MNLVYIVSRLIFLFLIFSEDLIAQNLDIGSVELSLRESEQSAINKISRLYNLEKNNFAPGYLVIHNENIIGRIFINENRISAISKSLENTPYESISMIYSKASNEIARRSAGYVCTFKDYTIKPPGGPLHTIVKECGPYSLSMRLPQTHNVSDFGITLMLSERFLNK